MLLVDYFNIQNMTIANTFSSKRKFYVSSLQSLLIVRLPKKFSSRTHIIRNNHYTQNISDRSIYTSVHKSSTNSSTNRNFSVLQKPKLPTTKTLQYHIFTHITQHKTKTEQERKKLSKGKNRNSMLVSLSLMCVHSFCFCLVQVFFVVVEKLFRKRIELYTGSINHSLKINTKALIV